MESRLLSALVLLAITVPRSVIPTGCNWLHSFFTTHSNGVEKGTPKWIGFLGNSTDSGFDVVCVGSLLKRRGKIGSNIMITIGACANAMNMNSGAALFEDSSFDVKVINKAVLDEDPCSIGLVQLETSIIGAAVNLPGEVQHQGDTKTKTVAPDAHGVTGPLDATQCPEQPDAARLYVDKSKPRPLDPGSPFYSHVSGDATKDTLLGIFPGQTEARNNQNGPALREMFIPIGDRQKEWIRRKANEMSRT